MLPEVFAVLGCFLMDSRDPRNGYQAQQLGRLAEIEFDHTVVRLFNAASEKASADDHPYDRTVYIGNRPPVTVQIKARNPGTDGKTQFVLAKGTGPRGKRWQPYRRNADYFALGIASGLEIREWYVIPAEFLEGRTTLTITGSRRERIIGFDPERFRGAWPVLRGEIPPELPKRSKPPRTTRGSRIRSCRKLSPNQMSFGDLPATVRG
jgi:hypothetical protein